MKKLYPYVGVAILTAGHVSLAYGMDVPAIEVHEAGKDGEEQGYGDISKTRKSKLEEEGGFKIVDETTKIRMRELRITAAEKKDGDETVNVLGARFTYASLFAPQPDSELYNGFYRLTAKADTDGLGRLNVVGGYHLPGVGNEVLVSYRLLYAMIRGELPISGAYEEHGLEHGLALRYSHYFEELMKSVSANVFMSRLNGDSELKIIERNTASQWSRQVVKAGYGDVDTISGSLDVALGDEGWDNGMVQGVRVDLGGGYEEVTYNAFPPMAEQSDSGFMGSVMVTVATSIGQWHAEYQDNQASEVAGLGWDLGQLSIFWRDIDYPFGSDETIFGVGLRGTFAELAHPGAYFRNLFKRPTRLFRTTPNGYDDIRTTHDFGRVENDNFIAEPLIIEVVESSAAVNKDGLPGDVHLNTEKGRLEVETPCEVAGIANVTPNQATEAFGYSGDQVLVDLQQLPNGQTTRARVHQRCEGNVDVYVNTDSDGRVTRVRVRKDRDKEDDQETTQTTTPNTNPPPNFVP